VVEPDGRLGPLAGEFAGLPLAQARSAIVKALAAPGLVVGFCTACATPVLARLQDLPVDPLADEPPVASCPSCGSADLTPDPDVTDTWMTSSLTPQINDGWALGSGSDPALAPMSMRVQAFEIIRTWLFYSVVQSELLFGRVPWRTALISGWGLSEQGKKLSKRDLDRSTGADGFNRYVLGQRHPPLGHRHPPLGHRHPPQRRRWHHHRHRRVGSMISPYPTRPVHPTHTRPGHPRAARHRTDGALGRTRPDRWNVGPVRSLGGGINRCRF